MKDVKNRGKARLRRKEEVNDGVEIVYDGDTFHIKVNSWDGVYHDETVRLYGVDTAELYGANHETAVRHRDFTVEWLEDSHDSIKDFPLDVYSYGRGSFGRVLLEVFDENGECLNKRLLEEFDVEYEE